MYNVVIKDYFVKWSQPNLQGYDLIVVGSRRLGWAFTEDDARNV